MNGNSIGNSAPTERLLPIGELLVEICEHIADADQILHFGSTRLAPSNLARLACVYRAFTKPALDRLWRDLSNLEQVVGVIHFDPSQTSEISVKLVFHLVTCSLINEPNLASLTQEQDWATLCRYTERVRSLRIDAPPSSAVKGFLLAVPLSRLLFGSLRGLDIAIGPPIFKLINTWEILPLCAPHQIRDFRISLASPDACSSDGLNRTCRTLIDFLQYSSESLRTLSVRPQGSWWKVADKILARTVQEIVTSCRGIETLNAPIDLEILPVISGLASLKDLRVDVISLRFPQVPPLPTFPPIVVGNLYIMAWQMGVKGAPRLNALLTAANIFASKRWGMHLFCEGLHTLQFIPELLDAIGVTKNTPSWKACTQTLVSFCLNGVEVARRLNVPLTFALFSPLLELPNLEELQIGGSRPVLVTDEDAQTIVEAWPRRKSLTLSATFDYPAMLDHYLPKPLSSSSPKRQAVVMTLEGVFQFARCKHLQSLEILVDASLVPASHYISLSTAVTDPGPLLATPCPLRYLGMGNSRIFEESKASTVEFLSRYFPSIESLTGTSMPPDWKREDKPGQWIHVWGEVQRDILHSRDYPVIDQ